MLAPILSTLLPLFGTVTPVNEVETADDTNHKSENANGYDDIDGHGKVLGGVGFGTADALLSAVVARAFFVCRACCSDVECLQALEGLRIAIQTSYAIASRYHVDVLSPRPGFVANVRRVLDYAGVAQGRVGPHASVVQAYTSVVVVWPSQLVVIWWRFAFIVTVELADATHGQQGLARVLLIGTELSLWASVWDDV